MVWRDSNLRDENQTAQELVEKLGRLPLMFEPGTTFEYSRSTDVLGRVVEVISGRSLGDFFAERIAGPLGMGDTGFGASGERAARVAEPQADPATGARPPMRNVAQPGRFQSGGGGAVSTAADYLRFCQMLLNGGELDGHRLLSPLTVRLMRSNVLPATARTLSPGTGFGLDFAVVEDPVAAGGYGGEGTFYWGGYAGTWFWIDPVYNLIVVGMIQQRADGMPDVRALSRSLTYQAIVK